MIQKKVCMLGAFAVGKTSLVSRYVNSIFSDKYLTTVGVKIDKKPIVSGDKEVNLILWDIHGEDDFQEVPTSYLRGAAGYLLVVDGTRKETLDTIIKLKERAKSAIGEVPYVVVINKSDLEDDWDINENNLGENFEECEVIKTSAKTGEGVEQAFAVITEKLLSE